MTKKKRTIALALGAAAMGVLCVAGCSLTRAGYESADYRPRLKDKRFELRDYPALTLVSTPLSARSKKGESSSFMRLFRYISGSNAEEKKISMTTPVFMTDSTDGQMSFVVPRDIATIGAPKARDALVEIDQLPAGTYAVYRFRGGRKESNVEDAKAALLNWITTQGKQPSGPVTIAGYDPPFTPVAFQRNEVLVRLSD